MRRDSAKPGGRRAGRFPRAAFTVLEILVVLALMALAAALVIGSGDALRAAARADAEDAVLTAIARARTDAVRTGSTLEFRPDDQARGWTWEAGRLPWAGDDAVRLLPPAPLSAVLIGGRVQEQPLARVRFYADGTCDPFRVEIARAAGASRILAIDPWTCVPLATPKEARR